MTHDNSRLLSSATGALVAVCFLATTGVPLLAKRDVGREVLAANDGWASDGAGTTGGSAAGASQIYVVRDRQQLVAALNDGIYPPSSTPSSQPKIVYVDGTIDANVDDDNRPLSCTDYYRNGYTLEAYLATYDPAVWGRKPPTGPLETARIASQQAQQARVRIRIGSNTTVVGLDRRATLRGVWFDLRGTSSVPRTNVIVRNLRFEDTYDCFPAWDPTDGATGNWNSAYDSVSLRDSDHVWIDHDDFADVTTADETLPTYFGRPYQVHDGEVDITNASNLVTVSWNRFMDHDKVMLIGSSDSATADRGRLKVTLHHNLFTGVGQRTPRVRFGQVHVYNNYYWLKRDPGYVYSWGVGIQSAIYAENNFFRTDADVVPSDFISVFNGTSIVTLDTQVDAASENHVVDVRLAYNDAKDPDLSDSVGWTPTSFTEVSPAFRVPSLVMSGAGPFNW